MLYVQNFAHPLKLKVKVLSKCTTFDFDLFIWLKYLHCVSLSSLERTIALTFGWYNIRYFVHRISKYIFQMLSVSELRVRKRNVPKILSNRGGNRWWRSNALWLIQADEPYLELHSPYQTFQALWHSTLYSTIILLSWKSAESSLDFKSFQMISLVIQHLLIDYFVSSISAGYFIEYFDCWKL